MSSQAPGGPITAPNGEYRLEVPLWVVTAVNEAFEPAVVAPFMRGTNSALGDRALLAVVAVDTPTEAEPRLLGV